MDIPSLLKGLWWHSKQSWSTKVWSTNTCTKFKESLTIPVYLVNISLVRPYFLDVGVRIVHMLLMSWGGEQARKELMLDIGRDLAAETSRAVTKILDSGVEHHDVRPPNVLWNPEIRNVVLVDFERSEILKQVSVLQETSPNRKRKHLHVDPKASCRILPDLSSMPASALIGAIHVFR